MAVAPESSRLVESAADVAALDDDGRPIALLAQTTLSHDEWSGVKEAVATRWPDMWMPGRSDLCFATTTRQSALRAIAPRADAMIVIGSANSSNTLALERVAIAAGCARVHRVNGPDEVPADLDGVVGVTAGASAPEELVRGVVERLNPANGVEVVDVTHEDEYFPPPRELRDLLRAVSAVVGLSLAAPAGDVSLLAADRSVAASDALEALGALAD
jgi:4-hydroxy-3-methylbut-2-enyl diphosphate reductase